MECAQAVKKIGRKFFIFGIKNKFGDKVGKCYAEHTKTERCTEGHEADAYNFYRVPDATSEE